MCELQFLTPFLVANEEFGGKLGGTRGFIPGANELNRHPGIRDSYIVHSYKV